MKTGRRLPVDHGFAAEQDSPRRHLHQRANSLPVLRALEENKLLGRVQVITTDLYHEIVPLLESGKVLATLYQRPETQGKVAFETLIGHLMDKDEPFRTHCCAPHIILRSNLSLFVHRLTTPSSMAAS